MNRAILYRPNGRWQICAAFFGAIALHVAAVAMNEGRSEPESVIVCIMPTDDVQGTIEPVEPSPLDANPPISEQLVPDADNMFIDEHLTPPSKHRVKSIAAPPRVGVSGVARSESIGSAKTLALFAPRPEYPYEARSRRVTGSGAATLTVDAASGSVIEVRMSQSTGSSILDGATLSAFRRWRFRPQTVSQVQVPITYTLTGASY